MTTVSKKLACLTLYVKEFHKTSEKFHDVSSLQIRETNPVPPD